MEREIQKLRDGLKKANAETNEMKRINKELLDQLNFQERSGINNSTIEDDDSIERGGSQAVQQ